MSHVTFENIKRTASTYGDYIMRRRSMGLYNVLDTEEGLKEFGHFIFDKLPQFQPNKKCWRPLGIKCNM